MAITFDLRNEDKSEFYDLISTSSIIRYIAGTYQDSSDNTEEDKQLSFSTIAKGTAVQIREAYRDIEILLNKAALWWQDNTLDESIYIFIEAPESPAPRRCLLKAWSRIDTSEGVSDPLLDKSLMVISNWTLTRYHAWEGGTVSEQIAHPDISVSCNTGAAMVGSTTDQTNNHDGFEVEEAADFLNDGTKQGRMMVARLAIPQSAGLNDWDRIWVGMKPVASVNGTASDKWAAHTNFTDAYGMTKIDTNVDGAKVASDALNSEVSEIDFTSEAFAPRLFNQIPHTHEDSSRGTYLVLMRLKVTAGTVARVAMFYAWDNMNLQGGKADTYEDIYIDNSDWHFYEMGIIRVPPEGYRKERRGSGNEGLHNLAIGISAERVSGTGSLFADYASWIPQEHFLYLSNAKAGGLTSNYTYIYTSEEGEVVGHNSRGGPTQHYQAEVTTKNWWWPTDAKKKFIVVTAADLFFADNEAHDFNESVQVNLTIRPRYHSFNAD